jgi:DNA polymerase-1
MVFDPKKTVFLIDGSSFLYRAYYGVRPLHTAKGIPVQAVYSFARMIRKLIDTFHPQQIAIVWDSRGKTTRHEMFENYKATRQAPPSDIFEQKKYIVEFADAIGMKQIAQQGIEADDIIYSIAQEQKALGNAVVMITSDKDMGQAIEDDRVVLFDPWKDVILNQKLFEEKMGLPVAKLPFYFSILGDTSDNIPGVKGIGDKGALELVNRFASLEDLYANLDKVSKERMRTALQNNKENAFLSYKLFLLQMHPSGLSTQDLHFDELNWVKARKVFTELDFKTLLKDIDAMEQIEKGVKPSVAEKMVGYHFITIVSIDQLENLCGLIKQKKLVALDTETNGMNPLVRNTCVGISLCVQEGTAYYIPFGHKNMQQLSQDFVVEKLKPIFEDESIKKVFHSAKFDLEALHGIGLEVKGLTFDTLLAANLITKDWQRIGLKWLSEHYFGEPMLSFQEVVKDNKYKDFSYVPLDLATRYAAADAHQTFRLKPLLEKALKEEQLTELYEKIEHPLTQLLYEMEVEGVRLDTKLLAELGKKVTKELADIEHQIGQLVGIPMEDLNLNSPRQVEQLLFVTLQLPPQKKSAKGTGYSTDQEVLEALSSMHPVPGLISKYRELAKLKSTYIDALPEYVNAHTNRIHTSYSQTQVATGRLSSFEPNLQNIPADTGGYGIEIRAAFIPPEGHLFLSADYSQIELRVLAYLSQDKHLLDAFLSGHDIHTETAARLFDVPFENVTSEQRQIGKRINFSVLYGMTPYGLAQDLGIPFKDAKEYIEKYFAQYPGVSAWMEKVVIDTKHNGYVTTHWGRRRYVPAIHEKNRPLYEEARRVAINTVAQGTAAEIMKLGMINLDQALKKNHLRAKVLLQIHDELLISVPKDELVATQELVKQVLESVVTWNVPLVVSTRAGKNWKEVTK